MSSVFTQILDGEIPGRFVWQEDDLAAFLTIAPLRPGHTLVVPRQEVDPWTALDDALAARLMQVARAIGEAQVRAWNAPRAGLVIAGFEVLHTHLHVFPAWEMSDFDFAKVDHAPDPADLDEAAERIRAALRELGHGEHVPG